MKLEVQPLLPKLQEDLFLNSNIIDSAGASIFVKRISVSSEAITEPIFLNENSSNLLVNNKKEKVIAVIYTQKTCLALF